MTVMGKYFKVPDLQGSVSIFLTLSEKKRVCGFSSDGSMASGGPRVAGPLLEVSAS